MEMVGLTNGIKDEKEKFSKYQKIISGYKRARRSASRLPNFLIASEQEEPSEFERICVATDDNSAVISMTLRELGLWRDESFWSDKFALRRVMAHYATSAEANVKNLFSLLLHDWCEPTHFSNDRHMSLKFEKFDENGNGSMFARLTRIANDKTHFGDVCVQALELYLGEWRVESFESPRMRNFIECALSVENFERRSRILKAILAIDAGERKVSDEVKNLVLQGNSEPNFARGSESFRLRLKNEALFATVFSIFDEKFQQFRENFQNFLDVCEENFGKYRKFAIESDVELLLKLTKKHPSARQLVLVKTDRIGEKNSELLQAMNFVFNEPLSDDETETLETMSYVYNSLTPNDPERLDTFTNFIKIQKVNAKLVFGRFKHNQMSFFETVMQNPKTTSVITTLLRKFQLHEHPQTLSMKNPLGRSAFSYIVENKNSRFLLEFLSVATIREENEFERERFLMLFDAQLRELTGQSLVEVVVAVAAEEADKSLDGILRKLLLDFREEAGDFCLDGVDFSDKFVSQIKQLGGSPIFGEVLRLMPRAWRRSKKRQAIDDFFPQFWFFLKIADENDDEFCSSFSNRVKDFEDFLKKVQKNPQNVGKSLRHLNFSLLLTAIDQKREKIVEFILDVDSFGNYETVFPIKRVCTQTQQFAALALMKRRNSINLENFPEHWVTADVLKRFLDSQLSKCAENLIEVDFGFVSTVDDGESRNLVVSDKTLMSENVKVLRYVEKKGRVNGQVLVHPVMETFINLRALKYRRIATWSNFSFIFLFILPFSPLLILKPSERHWNWLPCISLVYLLLREGLKVFASQSYLRKKSDWCGVLLLVVACTFLASVFFSPSSELCTISKSLLILLMAVQATLLITHAKAQIFFALFWSVSRTFLTIFDIFLFVIIGLALCFGVIFENMRCVEDVDKPAREEVTFDDFRAPFTAFVRILTMLSGEYSLDTKAMSYFQLAYFLAFVLVSFVLFNLIVGVSFDNIGDIMDESRQHRVLNNLREIIEMSANFENFYAKAGLSEKSTGFVARIFRTLLTRYIFIHKIDKVYVDMTSREVFVKRNSALEKALRVNDYGDAETMELEPETYQEILKILNHDVNK